jgi:glycosyltransferase involved in cell wall biosynthesis
MLRVSIITAVRNGRGVIQRTLDSVVSQNHPGIEHIVVDGASTDGTTEYLESRRSQIAVLHSAPDCGVYDAFNTGLRLATGDIVGYLNAGDVFANRTIAARIAQPFIDDSIEAVFGDVAMTKPTDASHVLRLYSSRLFSPKRARFGFMPAHPTLYLRRSVYELVGGYDSSFKIAGDYELVLRVFVKRHTIFRYLPATLVNMPVGGLSTRGWRSKLKITMEMKRACDKNHVKTNLALLSLRLPVKLLELLLPKGRSLRFEQ